ncbi:double-strand break repair helicase AddA [Pseudorhodobacter sp. E13]|uniref:double-strand break repair helicase AddA n=1 Tax=Pseudorhodobacter sp. E13 TaxID=2487931 RepID=UPI000F8F0920|nr:double-strand break repair helicase AddA [Pseudorhodobacter sp. E13]RUS59565.1 double-strand break repair helicase AddA [Pseudorhodobacter sp. E13]
MRRDAASERQVQSANPRASTWLSANAGSGKTRVLTDRVARMLLSGVDPGRILCLTYTKAAASEMQNRLFKRLGEWAMKEDAALRQALGELGVDDAVDAARLARARQLFARAIETPGGLRIQTIHSFCASLLRRFPLEAKVSPQFTEMDDRASALLREEIVDELADSIAPEVIGALAGAYTGEDFDAFSDEVAGRRGDFGTFLSEAECFALFDVPEGQTEDAILAQVFLGGESEWLAEATAIIATGTTNDVKAAEKLRALDFGRMDMALLSGLEGILLTGPGAKEPFTAKLGSFPTKGTQTKLGDLLNRLEDLMRRVEAARAARLALSAARRTAVLHRFAAVFLPIYKARKDARGWLDFDDLITAAKGLLTDPAVAQWVLFRLDGGIDHILVDEAQDTSPDQWRVIELLADEFTSGRSAREEPRTIFVVGDKKQSIYSFQGADVAAFDEKRDLFRAKLEQVQTPLQELQLEHSFRSSHTVLRLVDLTFDERRQKGLGGEVKHIAFSPDMPGRVEVWPVIERQTNPKPENWYDPVDLISEEHHAAKLGRKVAETIKALIDRGTQIPIKGGAESRAVHAGDFLILVRRRSEIFSEIIQACKTAGLPIAGADRLKLGAELAVRDLAALLAFLATPEDDLSLAACLRSPLFGWTEQQLYALAQPRKGYLWRALENDAAHVETVSILQDLRDQADFMRPYDLIERMLTRHDGRRKLLARLGAEAEDGIDELLSQALAYERNDVPSLTGFLGWLETDDVEVKRQMDSAGDRIRVMTVHGAKGLEAPIVILPDTAQYNARERNELFVLPQGAVWKVSKSDSPELIAQARAAKKARDEAEAMRLLYVAMTRAQSWLIVAAAGEIGADRSDEDAPGVVWYRLIQEAMTAAGAVAGPDGSLVLAEGDWPPDLGVQPRKTVAAKALPAWVSAPAPDAPRPVQPRNPSDLGGAKALAGDYTTDDDNRAAMDRGTQVHLLLEHLPNHPQESWPALADAMLQGSPDSAALLAEARAVLTQPAFSALFAPGTLAEAPITADLNGTPMVGTIDRLVITETSVLAVDFKSNLIVPQSVAEVPEGLLRQMAAYHSALCQIYPNRAVEVALLWTHSAQLMPLDRDIVRSALARTTLP